MEPIHRRCITINTKAFFKKYWLDFVVVGTLALASGCASIALAMPKSQGRYAELKVSNELVWTKDISDPTSYGEYEIQGAEGMVTVSIKDSAIAITKSSCPHQYCVFKGYINQVGDSIICAHNEVYISILGEGENDIIL